MNRNVESHFSENPTSLDIARSQFDRSSSIKFSANVGEVVPFYVDEVLPGDTFKVQTSKVVRLQTLLTPVMDNAYLDTYFFYVPNRLVWDHWKQFCGESDQAWTPSVEYTVPRLSIITHPGVGSLADYMGINPRISAAFAPSTARPQDGVNALPFRAYAKIMDDWFRDENLTDPLVIHTDDTTRSMNAKSAADIYCELGGPVFKASKYHDYFTSCLPAPQKGPTVFAGPTGLIPVGPYGADHLDAIEHHTRFKIPYGSTVEMSYLGSGSPLTATWVAPDPAATDHYSPVNLYADLGLASQEMTINDLRLAFQIQKFYEKQARGGTRYIEVLKSQFGVTSPDARLQRSEYLGGNRIPLTVNEVTNNSQGESSFLGDLGGMSRTVDVHDDFVKSFTEHGFVIGVCVVRYDHTYGQGLERFWSRFTKFDYYWPVFANIGEQPVYKKEIFLEPGPTWADDVFGYQEAWADYRYKPSRYAGEMRPGVTGSLSSWHYGDFYAAEPSLSDSWVREDKAPVDRTLAVTSAVSNQYFADIFIENTCSRCMPLYSIPGLADHH